MKYTIIGSGPSGLSLAYVLSLNNIEIDLIERTVSWVALGIRSG